MYTVHSATHRRAQYKLCTVSTTAVERSIVAAAASIDNYFFLCEVIAHCPKSRVCTGPPILGVMSNSNMSTGIPIVAHALGTSTMPASLPSQGEADSSK
jgi:hypothetical protein